MDYKGDRIIEKVICRRIKDVRKCNLFIVTRTSVTRPSLGTFRNELFNIAWISKTFYV